MVKLSSLGQKNPVRVTCFNLIPGCSFSTVPLSLPLFLTDGPVQVFTGFSSLGFREESLGLSTYTAKPKDDCVFQGFLTYFSNSLLHYCFMIEQISLWLRWFTSTKGIFNTLSYKPSLEFLTFFREKRYLKRLQILALRVILWECFMKKGVMGPIKGPDSPLYKDINQISIFSQLALISCHRFIQMTLLHLLGPSPKFVLPHQKSSAFRLRRLASRPLRVRLGSSHPQNFAMLQEIELKQEQVQVNLSLRYVQQYSVDNYLHNEVSVFVYQLQGPFDRPLERLNVNILVQLAEGYKLSGDSHSPNTLKVHRLFDSEPFSSLERHALLQYLSQQVKPTNILFKANWAIIKCQSLHGFTPQLKILQVGESGKFMAISALPNLSNCKPRRQKFEQECQTDAQSPSRSVSPRKNKRQMYSTFIGGRSPFEAQSYRKRLDSQDFKAQAQILAVNLNSRREFMARTLQAETASRTVSTKQHILKLHYHKAQVSFILVLTTQEVLIFKEDLSSRPLQGPIQFSPEHRIRVKSGERRVLVGNGSRVWVITPDFESGRVEIQSFQVERKLIQDLERYPDMKAIAVAGKNISKLSFFGKTTTRCNIKLYRASPPHSFISQHQVSRHGGVVSSCNYLSVQEALALFLQNQKSQELIFMRVSSQSESSVLLRLDMSQLGLGQILQAQKYLDRLVVLQRVQGLFYLKEMSFESIALTILNKDPQIPIHSINVTGNHILGLGRGRAQLLSDGLWVGLGEWQEAMTQGRRLWTCRGKQLHQFSLQKNY